MTQEGMRAKATVLVGVLRDCGADEPEDRLAASLMRDLIGGAAS
jgi:hypothetical protein